MASVDNPPTVNNFSTLKIPSVHHKTGVARTLRQLICTHWFAFVAVAFALLSAGRADAYEGYGNGSRGGEGGDIYHVTTLADSGPGSLRNGIANRSGPRTIVFDVSGTITFTNDLAINRPFLTIDGATAPAPGITITKDIDQRVLSISGTHDIIVRHLRLQGLYPNGAVAGTSGTEFLSIDGDAPPDHIAQRIVIDHVTVQNATDAGLDIWGEVADVTISWCLVANSYHPSTVSFVPAPFQKRRRISMHHNVYARNGERNPQLRADVTDFDYVNNIVYDWGYGVGGGYGVRIRNDRGEPQVSGNFVNNYFLAGIATPGWALIYGSEPGPDAEDGGPASIPAQGTVITNSLMGKLWVAGNILPALNKDHYSTIPQPNAVPTNAQVTTYQAVELKDRVVPEAGMKFRSAKEQTMLSEMAVRMQSSAALKVLRVTPTTCVLELKTPNTLRNEVQVADRLNPKAWAPLTNVLGTLTSTALIATPSVEGARFFRVISSPN